MTQLNFCRLCGNKRVKDVKSQLETLLQKKESDPCACGLCGKLILKEELIDKDHDGFSNDLNVSPEENISVPNSKRVKLMDDVEDNSDEGDKDEADAESDKSVDLDELKQEVSEESEFDDGDEGSNYSDEIEIHLKKDFSTEEESISNLDDGQKKRAPYPKKLQPIDLAYLHPQVREMIDDASIKPNSISCKTCSKVFTCSGVSIRNFVLHISDHSGSEPISKPYKCPQCDYTFKYSAHLKAHLMSHSDTKVLVCKLPGCEFGFNSKQGLRRHVEAVHHGVKIRKPKRPQVCQICGQVLESNASLKKHLMRHERQGKEKGFKCDVCGSAFYEELHLNRHKLRHQEDREKSCTCEKCGKSFHTKASLRTHLVTHSDDRKYQCQMCPYTAKLPSTLRSHKRNIHSQFDRDRNKCRFCELNFVSPGACTKHENKHQSGLDLAEVLQKRYQCQECGYRATKPCKIRLHMRVHTGEKKFQCVHCGKMCTQKSQATKHMKTCKKRF